MNHLQLIQESTADELRGQASPDQIEFLWGYTTDWLDELKNLKRRAETQMISGKVRRFSLRCEFETGNIDLKKFNEKMSIEMGKKINTFSFIKQIETRIATVKKNGKHSEQA